MGPPQAREMLIDCLSRVPGEAVLLTDNAFAGADTVATAYSLACAIRRIEREMLGGSRDYVIVTGMQSVDGDTAQVPPQIAEELGIEHIAYAQGLETEPELAVRRIGAAGHRDRPAAALPGAGHRHRLHGPALPLVPPGPRRPLRRDPRVERGVGWGRPEADRPDGIADAGLPHLLAQRGADQDLRLRPEPAELIERSRPATSRRRPGAEAAPTTGYDLAGRKPTYSGEFWVLAEREGDGIRSVSLELIGKARELADCLGVARRRASCPAATWAIARPS